MSVSLTGVLEAEPPHRVHEDRGPATITSPRPTGMTGIAARSSFVIAASSGACARRRRA